jgi:hypothetical protein
MSKRIAALASVVAFVAIKMLLDLAGRALGIVSYMDFGAPITVEHGLYDEEVDGVATDFGVFGLAAAAMIAWRVYHWICARKLSGNLTREQRTTWLACFVGGTIYTTLSLGVSRLGLPYPLPYIVKLSLAYGAYRQGRRWYLHKNRAPSWSTDVTANLNCNVRNNTRTP